MSNKTVLNGHISEETAYLIPDYPYGRTLRCKRKVWVETATKGKGKNEQRFVAMTNNPKITSFDKWNKPHCGNYYQQVILYRDETIGHIEWDYFDLNCIGDKAAEKGKEYYHQLDEAGKKRFETILYMSFKYNPTSWKEWREKPETQELFKKFNLPVEGALKLEDWLILLTSTYKSNSETLPVEAGSQSQ